MQLAELIRQRIITCRESDPVSSALDQMKRHGVGAVVVLKPGGELCGIVTDRDIAIRHGCKSPLTPVSDVMTDVVVYGFTDDDVFQAATQMATAGIRRLPVVDANGTAVGMVTLDDLLRLFSDQIAKLSRAVGKELTQAEHGSADIEFVPGRAKAAEPVHLI